MLKSQALVQNAPESKNIRPYIRNPTVDLFGRRVARAAHGADHHRAVVMVVDGRGVISWVGELGEQKADDDRLSVWLQNDVAGSDTAVDDPGPVNCSEGIGKLCAEGASFLDRELSFAGKPHRQRLPCERFHDEDEPVSYLHDIEESDDSRVIYLGNVTGFTQATVVELDAKRLGVVGGNLENHLPAQHLIPGAIVSLVIVGRQLLTECEAMIQVRVPPRVLDQGILS
jgi:hypothetical protein